MTVDTEDSVALDAMEAENAARASESSGGERHDGTDGATEEQRESTRRNRPGRMERQLAQAQRERDEALHYAQQAANVANTYARQLAESQEAGNRVAVDGMQQRIHLAEDQLRQAIQVGDADAVVKAQSNVSRMHAFAAQIASAPPPRAPRQISAPTAQPAPVEYTDTTQSWLDSNPWYGRDANLTALAKAVHSQAERAGHAVDSPGYWDFVENGIEAVAPGTVANRDTGSRSAAPRTIAAPRSAPSRNTSTTAPRNAAPINLTADEADAAKVSGMTPQEYKSWQTKLRAAGRLNGGAR